jgi:hypothetical protein
MYSKISYLKINYSTGNPEAVREERAAFTVILNSEPLVRSALYQLLPVHKFMPTIFLL